MFLCCGCILTQNQVAVTLYCLIWKFRSTPKSSNTGILHTECKACSEFFVNLQKFRKRSILIPSWVWFTMDLSQQLARLKLCKVQGTYKQHYLDDELSFQNLSSQVPNCQRNSAVMVQGTISNFTSMVLGANTNFSIITHAG